MHWRIRTSIDSVICRLISYNDLRESRWHGGHIEVIFWKFWSYFRSYFTVFWSYLGHISGVNLVIFWKILTGSPVWVIQVSVYCPSSWCGPFFFLLLGACCGGLFGVGAVAVVVFLAWFWLVVVLARWFWVGGVSFCGSGDLWGWLLRLVCLRVFPFPFLLSFFTRHCLTHFLLSLLQFAPLIVGPLFGSFLHKFRP